VRRIEGRVAVNIGFSAISTAINIYIPRIKKADYEAIRDVIGKRADLCVCPFLLW